MADPCLRIVQITDMHLQETAAIEMRGVNPEQRFLDVAAAVRSETADMLLLTGDLTHHSASAYQRLSSKLQSFDFPSYWIPGNHDLSGEMYKYSELGYGQKVIEKGNWSILLLDSTSSPDGKGGGSLSEPELDFLCTELDLSEKQNLLIVLHHHPVSVESRWQDNIMLGNADQFWSIIECYPQVRGVMFGHVHQAWQLQHKSVRLFSSPATAAQFKACTVKPETEDDPALSGPCYAVYELFEDGSIAQNVKRLSV